MFVPRKSIDRRMMLRGIGAAVALPLLDSMVPALSAAAKPALRFGVVYVPNGIVMADWTPATEGRSFEFTPILKSLEPYRDQLTVLSGMNSLPPATLAGQNGGVHARASTRFLTNIPPKPTQGAEIEAGISIDQIAAKQMGRETQLASLELGLESMESAGACDQGFSCAYTSTISWRGPTTPLPTENNPRNLFERLFGDTTSTDPVERVARIRQQRSLLDSVTQKIAGMQSKLGPNDRSKLTEYLEAIRDIERRIQKAEEQNTREMPVVDHPAGIPPAFEDHVKLMYDMYALSYQSDLTRVTTFMLAHEFSGRTYPQAGVPDAHHAISHHQGDTAKIAKLAKINAYHVKLFSYFLEKLRTTPDGDGSLLDHSLIMYGAGMSDSNAHDPKNLPILLAGGAAGMLKGGRHIRYPKATPLANLHLTLLDMFGSHIDKIGDSTGKLDRLGDA